MADVISSGARPSSVSRLRNREEVLGILLPKFLGLLWDRGKPVGPSAEGDIKAIPGDIAVDVDEELGIGALRMDGRRFIIHAYGSTAREPWTKLFSAHLGDTAMVDPALFRYWAGRCAILSWKRGHGKIELWTKTLRRGRLRI